MSKANGGLTRHFAPLVPPADVIALDGPAGAGKGTAARTVAELLGFNLLDSGALYRFLALQAIRNATEITNLNGLLALSRDCRLQFTPDGKVYYRRNDVTTHLRRTDVETLTPKIAASQQVRAALLELQMSYRVTPGLVTDGRDQYHIFSRESDAHRQRAFGFYITAEPEVRAARIARRRIDSGERDVDVAVILQQINDRDWADRKRPASPFQKHPDSFEIDTSSMTVEKMVSAIIEGYRRERLARGL